jgi:Family of unknown function (DUF6190)
VIDRLVFVDATVFLGMHHRNAVLRSLSVAFFVRLFHRRVSMNYEQVGICDAVIWKQRREVQDLYYPFMDRLHSEMTIVRNGYTWADLERAVCLPELRTLSPEQALLVAQVLHADGRLASHDPTLHALGCLEDRHWSFELGDGAAVFPGELQPLYEISGAFVHEGAV